MNLTIPYKPRYPDVHRVLEKKRFLSLWPIAVSAKPCWPSTTCSKKPCCCQTCAGIVNIDENHKPTPA